MLQTIKLFQDVQYARIDRGDSWFPSDIATDRAIAPGISS